MNICMVDVTHIRSARVGDEVVLLGKQKTEQIIPEEIAKKVYSINYEIPTRINPRIMRVAEMSTRINPDITRKVV
jgi:alanine racemase